MYLGEIAAVVQESIDTKKALLENEALVQQISNLAKKCVHVLKDGGKILFCGNGGSFADAQHISAEFTSRFLFDRPSLASLALGTNGSAISAIGNDYGYQYVFAREIESIATSKDLLVAITTSGNSMNILMALEAAKDKKLPAVVLAGSSRGKIREDTEVLNVPSSKTARIQECHILIGHIVCELAEQQIFENRGL